MPAIAGNRRRASKSRGRRHMAKGELCGVIKASDVRTSRNPSDAGDQLPHREHRDIATTQVDGGRTRGNRFERCRGTRGRRDDEVALDLDVGDGSHRIESDGRATEEVKRAAGARAPDRVSERGEVDGELGDIGGEGRGAVRSPDSPLASTEAQGSAEGAGALEAAVIILEGKIGGRRQGIAVIGDERTAREARGP